MSEMLFNSLFYILIIDLLIYFINKKVKHYPMQQTLKKKKMPESASPELAMA